MGLSSRVAAGVAAVALAAAAFAISAPAPAYATPTKTTACTSCHGTAASTTLAVTQTANDGTNATYSVSVGGGGTAVSWTVLNGTIRMAYAIGSTGTFTVPVGGTYTVWAVDNGDGAVSKSISPVAPAPVAKATTLSLGGVTSSVNGSPLRLDATLVASSVGVAGKPVAFQSSPNGTTWTAAGTGTTNASGVASFIPASPINGTRYRAVFAGDAGFVTSTSAAVTVSVTIVRTPTSATLSGNTVSTDGSPLALTGTLTANGTPIGFNAVVLETSVNGGLSWAPAGNGITGVLGTMGFSVVPSVNGQVYRLAFAGSTTHEPSSSATLTTSVAVSPKATALSLGGTLVSTDGSPLALSSVLTAAGTPVAGQSLALQSSTNGTTWIAAATATTAANGSASFAPVPATDGLRYRVVFAGNGIYVASTSATVVSSVVVSAKATALTLGGTLVSTDGSPLALSSVLSAAGVPVAGKTVTLQSSPDGAVWTPAGTATTAANGLVSFAPVPATNGLRYRVSFAGDAGYAASTSAAVVSSAVRTVPASALTLGGTLSSLDGSPLELVSVLSSNGTPLAGQSVALQRSSNGTAWTSAGTLVTDASGRVAFAPAATDGERFRTVFAGTAEYGTSTSPAVQVSVTVTPPAKLAVTIVAGGNLASVDGSAVSVEAEVSAESGPVAGRGLVFETSTDSGTSWTPAGTATTNASGLAALSTVPADGQLYRISFAGDAGYLAGTSNVVRATATVTPPPVGVLATTLSLRSEHPTVGYGRELELEARLSSRDAKVSGRQVMLQTSRNGHDWVNGPMAVTDGDGEAEFSTSIKSATWFRVVFAGDNAYATSTSAAVKVNPGMALGKPVLSRTPSYRKPLGFSAKAGHAVTGRVSFRVYSVSGSRSRLVKTLSVSKSGSTWKTSTVKLPKGSYRVVASYAGSDFAPTSTSTFFRVR